MDGWKMCFLLGRTIFRCYVSFREGKFIFQPIHFQGLQYLSFRDGSLSRYFYLLREGFFVYPPGDTGVDYSHQASMPATKLKFWKKSQCSIYKFRYHHLDTSRFFHINSWVLGNIFLRIISFKKHWWGRPKKPPSFTFQSHHVVQPFTWKKRTEEELKVCSFLMLLTIPIETLNVK